MKRAVLIILFFWGCGYLNAAEPEEIKNTGQYIFRPLRRFDIRQQVRQLSSDTDLHITIFRFDLPMPLNEGKDGIFSPRIDIPLIASDSVGNDNPNGDTYEYAAGDLLTQFAYIYPDSCFRDLNLDGFGFGVRMLWPVAGNSISGSEKYQVAPLVAAKWKLPYLSTGSFVSPILRYNLSYADLNEAGKNRDDINEFNIRPYLYVNTKKWNWPIDFVNLWADQDIVINFKNTDSKDRGDLFLPFDIMFGKMLNKNTVLSVDFAAPIVNDYDLYDWLIEFRIGFFF